MSNDPSVTTVSCPLGTILFHGLLKNSCRDGACPVWAHVEQLRSRRFGKVTISDPDFKPISENLHACQNLPKIIVAYQARIACGSLLDRGLLDRGQHRTPLLGRDRNAQFLAFEINAVG